MPKANLRVYSANNLTGDVTSQTVNVPQNVNEAYVLIILSAPISPLNVFDISVYIDVFENGEWRTRDSNYFPRDLVTGPTEAVNLTVTARMERIAGKQVQARLSCGQSVLAASVTVD